MKSVALQRILAPAAIIACLKLLPFRLLLHYGMRIDLHPVESIGEQLAKSKNEKTSVEVHHVALSHSCGCHLWYLRRRPIKDNHDPLDQTLAPAFEESLEPAQVGHYTVQHVP